MRGEERLCRDAPTLGPRLDVNEGWITIRRPGSDSYHPAAAGELATQRLVVECPRGAIPDVAPGGGRRQPDTTASVSGSLPCGFVGVIVGPFTLARLAGPGFRPAAGIYPPF